MKTSELLKYDLSTMELSDVHRWDYPDLTDAACCYLEWADGTPLTDEELDTFNEDFRDYIYEKALDSLF